jgi:hypothetical protein
MGTYKRRSDYFKMIATNNKLIAHNKPLSQTTKRKSFHRINDEAELDAACREWAHFPCMVHIGHDIRGRQPGTGTPRKITGNHIYFLSKLHSTGNIKRADAIEAAYEEAEKCLNQFVSYLLQDQEENNSCGDIFLFDVDRVRAEMIGPVNDSLYGWYLIFEDENKAPEMNYKGDDWFDGVPAPEDCHCNDGEVVPDDGDFIEFVDQTIVEIEMTQARKDKFGVFPLLQVWFEDAEGKVKLSIMPIIADAKPPYTTLFTIYNDSPQTGFVVLSKRQLR